MNLTSFKGDFQIISYKRIDLTHGLQKLKMIWTNYKLQMKTLNNMYYLLNLRRFETMVDRK